MDGASWQMILIIPESEYEDQYRFLWLSAALMLGSMIAVIVLMSYLLSGYYVGRLKKLNVEMTGLESGNLNANGRGTGTAGADQPTFSLQYAGSD